MATQQRSFFLLYLSTALLVQATPNFLHNRDALPFPITEQPLRPRQSQTPDNPGGSICGYRNGNLDRGWKAPEGSTCFLDHTASYFGFCNALFTKAADCTDVPRACVDSSTCSTGCGKTDQPDLPTITCSKASSFCYSNLLVTGELTYTAIGCDLERKPLIYSPAAGILDAPSSAEATPTDSASKSSTTSGASATPSKTNTSSPGASEGTESPSQTANPRPNVSESPSSGPAAAPASSSNNTGAIAGGIVGGLAVLAMAGLGFYFIRRRTSVKTQQNEPVELGNHDYRAASSEKFAYHSELPGMVAATELPPAREPVELHGETAFAETKKYGF